MSTKRRPQGPSLPKSILEHIQDAPGVCTIQPSASSRRLLDGQENNHRHKGKNHLSRKDARKQERLDRKKRRADHFSAIVGKHEIEEEHVDVPDSKRRKTVHFQDQVKSTPVKNIRPAESREPIKSKPRPTALEKLASQCTRKTPKAASRTPRTREEAEEDAYITYLEARLGYSKGSKRNQGDEADGLGGGYLCLM